jgi:cell division protein FtsQ
MRRESQNKAQSNNAAVLVKNIVKTLPVVFGVAVVFYLATLIKDVEAPTVVAVENIDVIGELRFLDKEKIIEQVSEDVVGGYFAIDMKLVRERLLQEPWIKEASLRRTWPADVTVFIEEQKPIAFWNDDGYLSETGEVFKPVEIDRELALPVLEGPDNQHENVLRFMNRLYREMTALNYQIMRLSLDDRRAWQIVIIGDEHIRVSEDSVASDKASDVFEEHSIDVKLGRFDTEKRLQRFIRILPALAAEAKTQENNNRDTNIKEAKVKVIDMRYPNGFAVQMAAETKGA